MLVVEPRQQGFLLHELLDRFVVIPDFRAFLRHLVLEGKQPIVGKHLAVKNE